MNTLLFISIRWLDVVDIVLVALFISYFYTLVRGTAAMRILMGLIAVLIFWKITKALQMELVADLVGTFIGVGSIAFVIIFQPELRAFLIRIGSNRIVFDMQEKGWFTFKKNLPGTTSTINAILEAISQMKTTKTGAIIVIDLDSDLLKITDTGTYLNADISTELITTIFFKNNALHDGAMVISKDKIIACGCILPNTNRTDLPKHFGLRHRAVIGLSESSNAFIISVSEESGHISTAHNGEMNEDVAIHDIKKQLLEIE